MNSVHSTVATRTRYLCPLLMLAFALLAAPAQAADNTASHVAWSTVDILLVRPMAAAATAFGAAVYAVSLPLTWPLGTEQDARESLIMSPYEDTFKRPLGEF